MAEQPDVVLLRSVIETDLRVFYEQQLDPDAVKMAAFPSRSSDAFMSHWSRIGMDDTVVLRTILHNQRVAGNIVSWVHTGEPLIGYWIGKEFWGKGVATRALMLFLDVVVARPVFARVARHNRGSVRVLEKCGFAVCGEDMVFTGGEQIEELIMRLG